MIQFITIIIVFMALEDLMSIFTYLSPYPSNVTQSWDVCMELDGPTKEFILVFKSILYFFLMSLQI